MRISHNPYLLFMISVLTSISSNDAILYSVCKSGWLTLVHHLETVEGFLPSSSASHLLVFFFSTRTILSRFKSSIIQESWFKRKVNEYSWDKKVDICYGAHVMEHMLIQEALSRSIVCRRKLWWLRFWSNRNLTQARVSRHNLSYECLGTKLALCSCEHHSF